MAIMAVMLAVWPYGRMAERPMAVGSNGRPPALVEILLFRVEIPDFGFPYGNTVLLHKKEIRFNMKYVRFMFCLSMRQMRK